MVHCEKESTQLSVQKYLLWSAIIFPQSLFTFNFKYSQNISFDVIYVLYRMVLRIFSDLVHVLVDCRASWRHLSPSLFRFRDLKKKNRFPSFFGCPIKLVRTVNKFNNRAPTKNINSPGNVTVEPIN